MKQVDWEDILKMLAGVVWDNVVDTYVDNLTREDLRYLTQEIEAECQNLMDNIEENIWQYIDENMIRERIERMFDAGGL